MFDVAILAGGLGTRLQGLWNGPKCLVPVSGRPLLWHLLRAVERLPVRHVIVATGRCHGSVCRWLSTERVPCIVHYAPPTGTTEPVRDIARRVFDSRAHALMVLNGDTLPRYSLSLLHNAFMLLSGPVAARTFDGVYAGASIFGSSTLIDLLLCEDRNWDEVANKFLPLHVPGFLDIGTPEGFQQAQQEVL